MGSDTQCFINTATPKMLLPLHDLVPLFFFFRKERLNLFFLRLGESRVLTETDDLLRLMASTDSASGVWGGVTTSSGGGEASGFFFLGDFENSPFFFSFSPDTGAISPGVVGSYA